MMKEEDEDTVLVVNSDSEEDENSVWITKSKNKQFKLLWEKSQPILFHYVLPDYKSTNFPYGDFKNLAADLRKSLAVVYVDSTKAFIWKNFLRWLISIKMFYEGISDLKYDDRYNLILTDFMAQYINYKCNLYFTTTDETELCRKVNEILVTLGVVFSGNIPGILMTLLKIEVKDTYKRILDPIFRKYLSNRNLHEPNELIAYLRLILCYRQWKKLTHLKEEKEEINELAVGKSEKTLRSKHCIDLTDRDAVLPKTVPPVTESNQSFAVICGLVGFAIRKKTYGTRILLINKSLDLEETIVKYFQQYEKYINRTDLFVSTKPVRIFEDGDIHDCSVEFPQPNSMKRPQSEDTITDSELFAEQEVQVRSGNKQGTNAVVQHLSTDCDNSILSNHSKFSSNSKPLSLSSKLISQTSNNKVYLSSMDNDQNCYVVDDDTTDDGDDDIDDSNAQEAIEPVDKDDKVTIDTVTSEKQTSNTLNPENSYIEILRERAALIGSNIKHLNSNISSLRRRSSIIVLSSSSDEDEHISPVVPARQAGSGGRINMPTPHIATLVNHGVSRLHGERVSRKEKPRCITGEVSSTTTPEAESSVAQNVGTEVGTLSAVRTSQSCGRLLASIDYSDLSDEDTVPNRMRTDNRLVSRLSSSKFSKVVEEATSSTSEVPIRPAETPLENVIFSIRPNRPRRSTSSSPCQTRNTSPIDSCTNNSPSSTIRTAGVAKIGTATPWITPASRITVRRLNSLIGSRDVSENATCSRYVVQPAAANIRNSCEESESEMATCSRYAAKAPLRVVASSNSPISDSISVTDKQKLSVSTKSTGMNNLSTKVGHEYVSVVGKGNNSDLKKYSNNISVHTDGSSKGPCLSVESQAKSSQTKCMNKMNLELPCPVDSKETASDLKTSKKTNSIRGTEIRPCIEPELLHAALPIPLLPKNLTFSSSANLKKGETTRETTTSTCSLPLPKLSSISNLDGTNRKEQSELPVYVTEKESETTPVTLLECQTEKGFEESAKQDSQPKSAADSIDKESKSMHAKSIECRVDTTSVKSLFNEPKLCLFIKSKAPNSSNIVVSEKQNKLPKPVLNLDEKDTIKSAPIIPSSPKGPKDQRHQQQNDKCHKNHFSLLLEKDNCEKPKISEDQYSPHSENTAVVNTKIKDIDKNSTSRAIDEPKAIGESIEISNAKETTLVHVQETVKKFGVELSPSSLLEDELSNDEEIESPAYEPISCNTSKECNAGVESYFKNADKVTEIEDAIEGNSSPDTCKAVQNITDENIIDLRTIEEKNLLNECNAVHIASDASKIVEIEAIKSVEEKPIDGNASCNNRVNITGESVRDDPEPIVGVPKIHEGSKTVEQGTTEIKGFEDQCNAVIEASPLVDCEPIKCFFNVLETRTIVHTKAPECVDIEPIEGVCKDVLNVTNDRKIIESQPNGSDSAGACELDTNFTDESQAVPVEGNASKNASDGQLNCSVDNKGIKCSAFEDGCKEGNSKPVYLKPIECSALEIANKSLSSAIDDTKTVLVEGIGSKHGCEGTIGNDSEIIEDKVSAGSKLCAFVLNELNSSRDPGNSATTINDDSQHTDLKSIECNDAIDKCKSVSNIADDLEIVEPGQNECNATGKIRTGDTNTLAANVIEGMDISDDQIFQFYITENECTADGKSSEVVNGSEVKVQEAGVIEVQILENKTHIMSQVVVPEYVSQHQTDDDVFNIDKKTERFLEDHFLDENRSIQAENKKETRVQTAKTFDSQDFKTKIGETSEPEFLGEEFQQFEIDDDVVNIDKQTEQFPKDQHIGENISVHEKGQFNIVQDKPMSQSGEILKDQPCCKKSLTENLPDNEIKDLTSSTESLSHIENITVKTLSKIQNLNADTDSTYSTNIENKERTAEELSHEDQAVPQDLSDVEDPSEDEVNIKSKCEEVSFDEALETNSTNEEYISKQTATSPEWVTDGIKDNTYNYKENTKTNQEEYSQSDKVEIASGIEEKSSKFDQSGPHKNRKLKVCIASISLKKFFENKNNVTTTDLYKEEQETVIRKSEEEETVDNKETTEKEIELDGSMVAHSKIKATNEINIKERQWTLTEDLFTPVVEVEDIRKEQNVINYKTPPTDIVSSVPEIKTIKEQVECNTAFDESNSAISSVGTEKDPTHEAIEKSELPVIPDELAMQQDFSFQIKSSDMKSQELLISGNQIINESSVLTPIAYQETLPATNKTGNEEVNQEIYATEDTEKKTFITTSENMNLETPNEITTHWPVDKPTSNEIENVLEVKSAFVPISNDKLTNQLIVSLDINAIPINIIKCLESTLEKSQTDNEPLSNMDELTSGPKEKDSYFNAWSNENENPILLNLKRTEGEPVEDDSNLSTQVQVATEDLGDSTLSFDSDTFESAVDSNIAETDPKSSYHLEDQEVFKITSQSCDNLTYNTYQDDCGTPVLDEKNVEEFESPTSQGKIISLSILKEITSDPSVLLPTFSSQILSPQITKSALIVPTPIDFSGIASFNSRVSPAIHSPIASIPTTNSHTNFVEPSPKPKPNDEIDLKYQNEPLKMRLKRRISQCTDINEEFNLGPSEPVKHVNISNAQLLQKLDDPIVAPIESLTLANYAPLNLVIRSEKPLTAEHLSKVSLSSNIVKDSMSLAEEDQNICYQKSWFKKLGISKTNPKTPTNELRRPPPVFLDEEISTAQNNLTSKKEELVVESLPEKTPEISKHEGRRRKPRRVKKLMKNPEIQTDDSSAERHLIFPAVKRITVATSFQTHMTGLQDQLSPQLNETSYNPEDIKAATILSDMLKKSNKVDESPRIDREKVERQPCKQKMTKQEAPQCIRLTRSKSQKIDKSCELMLTPPAAPTKSSVKNDLRQLKGSATKKRDLGSSESIWQQEKTQQILRSYTTSSDPLQTKSILVEEAKLTTPQSNCSTDSDDVGKLVIDLNEKNTFDSKEKMSQTKAQQNCKRRGTGRKIGIERKKGRPKKESIVVESPVVQYDERRIQSTNSVFKLTPEVDVIFSGAQRSEASNVTDKDNCEQLTFNPAKRKSVEFKSSDDDVSRFYPIVELTEDFFYTPKIRGPSKRGGKQTFPSLRGRKVGRRFFEEDPETVLDSSFQTTPTNRGSSRSKNSTTDKMEDSMQDICQKDGDSPEKSIDDLIKSPNAVPNGRPKRLSFGIDTILGTQVDSSQIVGDTEKVETLTNTERDTSAESILPGIAMNKEIWLTNLLLRKTSKSIDEVVKKLSEKPEKETAIRSSLEPTTETDTKSIVTEENDQHQKNNIKSLIAYKKETSVKKPAKEITSEIDVLKIKEELKQLQPKRNRRKSLRSAVKILNAGPNENSEDNESFEASTQVDIEVSRSTATINHIEDEGESAIEIMKAKLGVNIVECAMQSKGSQQTIEKLAAEAEILSFEDACESNPIQSIQEIKASDNIKLEPRENTETLLRAQLTEHSSSKVTRKQKKSAVNVENTNAESGSDQKHRKTSQSIMQDTKDEIQSPVNEGSEEKQKKLIRTADSTEILKKVVKQSKVTAESEKLPCESKNEIKPLLSKLPKASKVSRECGTVSKEDTQQQIEQIDNTKLELKENSETLLRVQLTEHLSSKAKSKQKKSAVNVEHTNAESGSDQKVHKTSLSIIKDTKDEIQTPVNEASERKQKKSTRTTDSMEILKEVAKQTKVTSESEELPCESISEIKPHFKKLAKATKVSTECGTVYKEDTQQKIEQLEKATEEGEFKKSVKDVFQSNFIESTQEINVQENTKQEIKESSENHLEAQPTEHTRKKGIRKELKSIKYSENTNAKNGGDQKLPITSPFVLDDTKVETQAPIKEASARKQKKTVRTADSTMKEVAKQCKVTSETEHLSCESIVEPQLNQLANEFIQNKMEKKLKSEASMEIETKKSVLDGCVSNNLQSAQDKQVPDDSEQRTEHTLPPKVSRKTKKSVEKSENINAPYGYDPNLGQTSQSIVADTLNEAPSFVKEVSLRKQKKSLRAAAEVVNQSKATTSKEDNQQIIAPDAEATSKTEATKSVESCLVQKILETKPADPTEMKLKKTFETLSSVQIKEQKLQSKATRKQNKLVENPENGKKSRPIEADILDEAKTPLEEESVREQNKSTWTETKISKDVVRHCKPEQESCGPTDKLKPRLNKLCTSTKENTECANISNEDNQQKIDKLESESVAMAKTEANKSIKESCESNVISSIHATMTPEETKLEVNGTPETLFKEQLTEHSLPLIAVCKQKKFVENPKNNIDHIGGAKEVVDDSTDEAQTSVKVESVRKVKKSRNTDKASKAVAKPNIVTSDAEQFTCESESENKPELKKIPKSTKDSKLAKSLKQPDVDVHEIHHTSNEIFKIIESSGRTEPKCKKYKFKSTNKQIKSQPNALKHATNEKIIDNCQNQDIEYKQPRKSIRITDKVMDAEKLSGKDNTPKATLKHKKKEKSASLNDKIIKSKDITQMSKGTSKFKIMLPVKAKRRRSKESVKWIDDTQVQNESVVESELLTERGKRENAHTVTSNKSNDTGIQNDKVPKPKMIMQIRRLSIDETNIKMSIERCPEVVGISSTGSHKHIKKEKKPSRNLGVKNSTDSTSSAVPTEKEINALKNINCQTDSLQLNDTIKRNDGTAGDSNDVSTEPRLEPISIQVESANGLENKVQKAPAVNIVVKAIQNPTNETAHISNVEGKTESIKKMPTTTDFSFEETEATKTEIHPTTKDNFNLKAVTTQPETLIPTVTENLNARNTRSAEKILNQVVEPVANKRKAVISSKVQMTVDTNFSKSMTLKLSNIEVFQAADVKSIPTALSPRNRHRKKSKNSMRPVVLLKKINFKKICKNLKNSTPVTETLTLSSSKVQESITITNATEENSLDVRNEVSEVLLGIQKDSTTTQVTTIQSLDSEIREIVIEECIGNTLEATTAQSKLHVIQGALTLRSKAEETPGKTLNDDELTDNSCIQDVHTSPSVEEKQFPLASKTMNKALEQEVQEIASAVISKNTCLSLEENKTPTPFIADSTSSTERKEADQASPVTRSKQISMDNSFDSKALTSTCEENALAKNVRINKELNTMHSSDDNKISKEISCITKEIPKECFNVTEALILTVPIKREMSKESANNFNDLLSLVKQGNKDNNMIDLNALSFPLSKENKALPENVNNPHDLILSEEQHVLTENINISEASSCPEYQEISHTNFSDLVSRANILESVEKKINLSTNHSTPIKRKRLSLDENQIHVSNPSPLRKRCSSLQHLKMKVPVLGKKMITERLTISETLISTEGETSVNKDRPSIGEHSLVASPSEKDKLKALSSFKEDAIISDSISASSKEQKSLTENVSISQILSTSEYRDIIDTNLIDLESMTSLSKSVQEVSLSPNHSTLTKSQRLSLEEYQALPTSTTTLRTCRPSLECNVDEISFPNLEKHIMRVENCSISKGLTEDCLKVAETLISNLPIEQYTSEENARNDSPSLQEEALSSFKENVKIMSSPSSKDKKILTENESLSECASSIVKQETIDTNFGVVESLAKLSKLAQKKVSLSTTNSSPTKCQLLSLDNNQCHNSFTSLPKSISILEKLENEYLPPFSEEQIIPEVNSSIPKSLTEKSVNVSKNMILKVPVEPARSIESAGISKDLVSLKEQVIMDNNFRTLEALISTSPAKPFFETNSIIAKPLISLSSEEQKTSKKNVGSSQDISSIEDQKINDIQSRIIANKATLSKIGHKNVALLSLHSSPIKLKRLSLDDNQCHVSSVKPLRKRRSSLEHLTIDIPPKKAKLSEEQTTNIESKPPRTEEDAKVLSHVEVKTKTKQGDEVMRVDEQLELSIINILGKQLSENESTNSSGTMSKVIVTNRPQGFDSVPDDIFAGNGDTSDNSETKFCPILFNPEDLMPKTTQTNNSNTPNSDQETRKLNDDDDNDAKQPLLKMSSTDGETDDTVNLTNGSSSEFPCIPDINAFASKSPIFEENYMGGFVEQNDCLTDVLGKMMEDMPSFPQSHCMMDRNYRNDIDNIDIPLCLLGPPLLCIEPENYPRKTISPVSPFLFLEPEIDAMKTVSPFDLVRKTRKANELPEIDLDYENEFLAYSDLVSMQSREKSELMYTTSTPTKKGENDDAIFKRPDCVRMPTEESIVKVSAVPQQSVNYNAPAVEVSTEIGFDTYDELLPSSSHFFTSSKLENSRKRSRSTSDNESEVEPVPAIENVNPSQSVESDTLCSESKKNDIKPTSIVENGLSTQAKQKDTKTLSNPEKSKWIKAKLLQSSTVTKQKKITDSPIKLKSHPPPFWKKKALKSKTLDEISNEPAPGVARVKMDFITESVEQSAPSLNADVTTIQECKSLPIIDDIINEIPPKIMLTKLPELGEITVTKHKLDDDSSAEQPLNKKLRVDDSSRLSTNDLFDRLKQEPAINPVVTTSKPAEHLILASEVDDNSSRESDVGEPTTTVSKVIVSDVPLPSIEGDCATVPSKTSLRPTTPEVFPSMPIISVSSRVESTPKLVNTAIEHVTPKCFTEEMIGPSILIPKIASKKNELIDNLLAVKVLSKRSRFSTYEGKEGQEGPPPKITTPEIITPLLPQATLRFQKSPSNSRSTSPETSQPHIKQFESKPKSLLCSVQKQEGKSSKMNLVLNNPEVVHPQQPDFKSPSNSCITPATTPPLTKQFESKPKPVAVHPTFVTVQKHEAKSPVVLKNTGTHPTQSFLRLYKSPSNTFTSPGTTPPLPQQCESKPPSVSVLPTSLQKHETRGSKVTFSPVVSKIPEKHPLMIRPIPSTSKSNSGTPSQPQKPIKSILLPSSRHSLSKHNPGQLSSPSTSQKLLQPSHNSHSRSSSSTSRIDAPASSHIQKSLPTAYRLSKSEAIVQSPKVLKHTPPPTASASHKNSTTSCVRSVSPPNSRRTPLTSYIPTAPAISTPTPWKQSPSRSSSGSRHKMKYALLLAEIESLADMLKNLPQKAVTYSQHKERKQLVELHDQKCKQLEELKQSLAHEDGRSQSQHSRSRSHSERQPLDSFTAIKRPVAPYSQRESKDKHRESRRTYYCDLEKNVSRQSVARLPKTLPSWDPNPASADQIIADLKMGTLRRN